MKFVKIYLPFIANETTTNYYLAVLFPIISLLLALYILNNVPKFIHYQRLREIYYTLKVYKFWRDRVNERERRRQAQQQ